MYTPRIQEIDGEQLTNGKGTQPTLVPPEMSPENGTPLPSSAVPPSRFVDSPTAWKVALGLPGLLKTMVENVVRGRPKGEGERRLNLHAPQMLVMLSDIATMAETHEDAVGRLQLIAKMARKTVADATGVAFEAAPLPAES